MLSFISNLKPIMTNTVNLPTCGRIVHYYPADNDVVCRANGVEFIPAIVIQSFGILHANILVFTMNQDAREVLRYSVNHKSEALPGQSYWEWPTVPAPVVSMATNTGPVTDGTSGDTNYKEWSSSNANRA